MVEVNYVGWVIPNNGGLCQRYHPKILYKTGFEVYLH